MVSEQLTLLFICNHPLLLIIAFTAMESVCCSFTTSVSCTIQKAPPPTSLNKNVSSLSSTSKRKQLSLGARASELIKAASLKLLDIFVDSVFKFREQPFINEGNFAPVEEIGEAVIVSTVEGQIPDDFPEGIYIRTGPNYLYPTQTAATSILGRTQYTWVEGDGMLHATYFNKEKGGKWCISYKNRYVEAETFLLEKERNKALFLPATDGHPNAILASFFLNILRSGKAVRDTNNTNVFEHGGRVFAAMEGSLPYEINPSNLETVGAWDVNGGWDMPFIAHPKRAPKTGEMIMMGTSPIKPHLVVGVLSADGKKMLHKADLKFKKGTLIHDIGVTENYNIILDYPLRFDLERVSNGKSLIGFEKEEQSRIGVMPRYGDAESVVWFNVKSNCSFHFINSFEDGDEVIVRCCRASDSVIPGIDHKIDRAEWYRRAYSKVSEYSEGFDPDVDGVLFTLPYEWRLNMRTGKVREGYLTRKEIAMDFPAINGRFMGCKNKYGYTQVVDSVASSNIGIPKFKMFAKLYLDEQDKDTKDTIKVEYHEMEANHFCSGAQFVEKPGAIDEDDGWLICYIHDEITNISKVCIIDTKRFTEEPVARIILPRRVPYGFHGMFLKK